MRLDEKWSNYFTVDQINKKSSGSIETFSLIALKEAIDVAIENCKRNKFDPSRVPVFIKIDDSTFSVGSMSQAFHRNAIYIGSHKEFEFKYIAPDSRPSCGGEYWTSRGCSSSDCSGFVVSKLAGERILRMVKYILETDTPKSWLDYREYEPDWIQFKFSAEEFNITLLSELSSKNNNIVNEQILRQCKLCV